MTREDIQIVEENAHLKHFIFDLVRCIDEGIPVANYFACADQKGGVDDALYNAQKYVADSLSKRVFFGGVSECKFKVGDKVIIKGAPERVTYRIRDIIDIVLGVDELNNFFMSNGVLIEKICGRSRVYPVSYVNKNFELYDEEA